MKTVWHGPVVYIDQADADSVHENEYVTFINWGNMLIQRVQR